MTGVFKVLSLNIGSSTTLAGLKPQLVMLQEVTLTSEQLNVQVTKFGYKAATNIDISLVDIQIDALIKNTLIIVIYELIFLYSIKFNIMIINLLFDLIKKGPN